MLQIRALGARYDRSQVLHDVTLGCGPGEVVCLLGRNGVGKSTTLKSVMGLMPATSGEILFEAESIAGLPPYAIARRGIGYVPEERLIFPDLTVDENLSMGVSKGFGRPPKAAFERIFALFPRLAEKTRQAGRTLSGGEQQMLSIGETIRRELGAEGAGLRRRCRRQDRCRGDGRTHGRAFRRRRRAGQQRRDAVAQHLARTEDRRDAEAHPGDRALGQLVGHAGRLSAYAQAGRRQRRQFLFDRRRYRRLAACRLQHREIRTDRTDPQRRGRVGAGSTSASTPSRRPVSARSSPNWSGTCRASWRRQRPTTRCSAPAIRRRISARSWCSSPRKCRASSPAN
ncbi:MAG: ATP-binding cassette domain-containing protein [Aliidongia sp.]